MGVGKERGCGREGDMEGMVVHIGAYFSPLLRVVGVTPRHLAGFIGRRPNGSLPCSKALSCWQPARTDQAGWYVLPTSMSHLHSCMLDISASSRTDRSPGVFPV